MRTQTEFINEYAKSHQNPTHQIIHLICVPAIFIASIALLWYVPIGKFIPGVPADWAPYINAASLGLPVVLGFYAKLSKWAVGVGVAWLLVSFALTIAGFAAGLPVWAIAAAAWLIAWAVQFYGHHVEGAKPSFADDLLFLLIGPLYVQQKFKRLLTTGTLRPQAH